MIQIVVSAPPGARSPGLTKDLSGCVDGGFGDVQRALQNGRPLFDGDLLARPKEETFRRLRVLVASLRNHGFEPIVSENGRSIDADTLLNIMKASEDSKAEADRLADFGHDV